MDVEEVRRLHLEEGLPVAEIARRLDYQAHSVARALRRAGVRIRRRRPLVSTERDRRLHITWRSIVGRCTRRSDRLYARYGARGVRIFAPWSDFEVFRSWALASGWKPGLSLGLKVRSKGYAPGNCAWIPRGENIKRGILAGPRGASWGITAFGDTKTALAWAQDPRCTVGAQGLLDRLARGMRPELAINAPRFSDSTRVGLSKRRPRRGSRPRRVIDWDRVRDLHVEKRLDVSETALALDASYHAVLRGLRERGWLIEHKGVPWSKLRYGRLLHKTWGNMFERCQRVAHPQYGKVGGKGIKVCEQWGDFGAFHAWALRSGYRPGLCLTRVERRQDYGPANCHWITRQEMSKSVEPTISRKPRWTVTAFGETKGPYAWSRDRRCSVSISGLVVRLRHGWKPEEAIVTPSKTGPKEPAVWVTAFGETKGVEDWVRDRRCRVGPASLRARLRKGVPAEIAITAEPFRVSRGRQ